MNKLNISIIALVGAVVGIWSAFEYSMHRDEYRKRVEAALAEYVKTGLYVFGRVHVRVKKLGYVAIMPDGRMLAESK